MGSSTVTLCNVLMDPALTWFQALIDVALKVTGATPLCTSQD